MLLQGMLAFLALLLMIFIVISDIFPGFGISPLLCVFAAGYLIIYLAKLLLPISLSDWVDMVMVDVGLYIILFLGGLVFLYMVIMALAGAFDWEIVRYLL